MISHFLKLTIAIVIFAAGVCFGAAAGRAAAGDEPWCIINDEGNSHCYYRTAQECLQAIASGARGFCNGNPSGGSTPSAVAPPAQRKRRAQ